LNPEKQKNIEKILKTNMRDTKNAEKPSWRKTLKKLKNIF